MRKIDEYWVKKCMEFRVECRRLVGRPRMTWLESVEADRAALDKENFCILIIFHTVLLTLQVFYINTVVYTSAAMT